MSIIIGAFQLSEWMVEGYREKSGDPSSFSSITPNLTYYHLLILTYSHGSNNTSSPHHLSPLKTQPNKSKHRDE